MDIGSASCGELDSSSMSIASDSCGELDSSSMSIESEPCDVPLQELHENMPIEVVGQRLRVLQQVSTIATRKLVISWMIEDESLNGEKLLISRTVAAFPEYFRANKAANLMKASRWWKTRDEFFPNDDEDNNLRTTCSRSRLGRRTRMRTKAFGGRGHKRSQWVCWLYPRLLTAFECLRKAGVKFTSKLLQSLAKEILVEPDSRYTRQSRDVVDGKLIIEKVCYSWMQQFLDVHNIVLLTQTGRLLCSPEKERYIRRITAYHLGILQRGFSSGLFDENLMENIDETHFVVNMDNGHTLGFRGDTCVKYADVVSGGDAMTMVVRISGGRRAMIEDPMLIFTNGTRSYPIRGLPDNIPGVSYRTGPKGWMDQTLFSQYFEEARAFQSDVHGRMKMVWVDNCSSHNLTPELRDVLIRKHATLCYLPPCTTHLTQPADTFIISKIKDAWTSRWEAKKFELIERGTWQNIVRGDGSWSGKLSNPGKGFFLQLAADSVNEVNSQVDENGISYARKAMIRCGMALDVDGSWNLKQLFPGLQKIVADDMRYFDGEDVPALVP